MGRQESCFLLRSFVDICGGQKAASIKLGVSPQFVGQMFHGKRAVPVSIVKKLKPKRNGK